MLVVCLSSALFQRVSTYSYAQIASTASVAIVDSERALIALDNELGAVPIIRGRRAATIYMPVTNNTSYVLQDVHISGPGVSGYWPALASGEAAAIPVTIKHPAGSLGASDFCLTAKWDSGCARIEFDLSILVVPLDRFITVRELSAAYSNCAGSKTYLIENKLLDSSLLVTMYAADYIVAQATVGATAMEQLHVKSDALASGSYPIWACCYDEFGAAATLQGLGTLVIPEKLEPAEQAGADSNCSEEDSTSSKEDSVAKK